MSDKTLLAYKDLLMDKKVVCMIAVGRTNDAPHLTPVWFGVTEEDFDNKELTFNTLRGRVKANLLKVGTKLSISMVDPDEPSRYLSMGGIVERIIGGEEGLNHIHELSHKYTGHDAVFLQPGDERLKYIIKITELY